MKLDRQFRRAALATALLAMLPASHAAGDDTLVVNHEPAPGQIHSIEQRVLDTRTIGARLDAGDTHELALGGIAAIPATARSVLANVVAVDPAGPGFLTVYDCAVGRPGTSNVNFHEPRTIANAVLVGISDRRVCVYSLVATDVVIDLAGTFEFTPGAATRAVDTRLGMPVTRLTAGDVVPLDLSSGTAAGNVLLNVTATNTTSAGFALVADCAAVGDSVPNSSVNFRPGETVANLVVAPDRPCLTASTDVDIVIDLVGRVPDVGDPIPAGWVGPTSAWNIDENQLRFDTREPNFTSQGRLGAGETAVIPYTGFLVDRTTRALVVNLTVVNPDANGYLTAYRCDFGTPPPVLGLSTMNYATGDVLAHQTIVTRDPGEYLPHLCVYTSAATDVIVDFVGTVESDVGFAVRTFDTCGYRDDTGSTATNSTSYEQPVGPVDRSGSVPFSVQRATGPLTIAATGPVGWNIDVQPIGTASSWSGWGLDLEVAWTTPPIGLRSDTITVTITNGPRTETLTVGVTNSDDSPEYGDC